MTKMNKYEKQAHALVEKLRRACTPRTMRENYGQDQVRKFLEKIEKEAEYRDLYYAEKCAIEDITRAVSRITY